MMRTVTLKDFVLEEFNRMLVEEGRDIQILPERPKPRLVSEQEKIVAFRKEEQRSEQ
jgi:hypothetical protein